MAKKTPPANTTTDTADVTPATTTDTAKARKKPQGREQAFRVKVHNGEMTISRAGRYFSESIDRPDEYSFEATEQRYDDGSSKVTVTIENATPGFDAYNWAVKMARAL